MRREDTTVCSMTEFLWRMASRDNRKVGATLYRFQPHSGEEIYLEEHFDDGKGHSGAFWSDRAHVPAEIFTKALEAGYIRGKLEPGFVSNWQFVVSETGQKEHAARDLAAMETRRWIEAADFSASDIKTRVSNTSLSLEVIQEILAWLTKQGRVKESGFKSAKRYTSNRQSA